MNERSTLQAFRDADPAADAEPSLSVDDLLARVSTAEASPIDVSPARRRASVGRRVALVAAAVAAAIAVPVFWPSSQSPIPAPSAFAIDEDHGAVTITIPLNHELSAATFRAALAKAHLDATVFQASASCDEPAQDGLPVYGYFVATRPVNDVQRVTFSPAAKPAGAKLVFSLETGDGTTAASWWLTDQLPRCVPLSVIAYPPGSAGPDGPFTSPDKPTK